MTVYNVVFSAVGSELQMSVVGCLFNIIYFIYKKCKYVISEILLISVFV
jgi:hypothetical protein